MKILKLIAGWIKRWPADSLVITKAVIDGRLAVEGKILKMAVINDVQQIQLAVEGRSARGNPAQVYGVPTWGTDRPELVELQPAADGLSCNVKALGPLGDAIITVQAQVRQDAQVFREAFITVSIAGGESETLAIVEGAITTQPEFEP